MVAKRAGVSQVTVFNHFGDKHGLIEAAVARIADAKVDEYRRALLSDGPWPERLRSIIKDKGRVLRGLEGVRLRPLP
jgi:AcrR family transcriptional regulator